jgi:hypothetical protein
VVVAKVKEVDPLGRPLPRRGEQLTVIPFYDVGYSFDTPLVGELFKRTLLPGTGNRQALLLPAKELINQVRDF